MVAVMIEFFMEHSNTYHIYDRGVKEVIIPLRYTYIVYMLS
jgi:hypothetical protein